MKIVGLIPARGGSKGIRNKNLALLSGRPLLVHTIRQAKRSKYLDKIVVSSEEEKILTVAKAAGSEVILRPSEFARDDSRMDDVMIHALSVLASQQYIADLVVLLQPTSPLRNDKVIDTAIDAFLPKRDQYDSLVPLEETSAKIGIIDHGRFMPQYLPGMQRQELSVIYHDCGAVYIFKPDVLRCGEFFGKRLFAFPIAWPASLDIDTPEDLQLAEYYVEKFGN